MKLLLTKSNPKGWNFTIGTIIALIYGAQPIEYLRSSPWQGIPGATGRPGKTARQKIKQIFTNRTASPCTRVIEMYQTTSSLPSYPSSLLKIEKNLERQLLLIACFFEHCKVHIFWEGHKILQNLHLTLTVYVL